ncbi:MAG TPA: bifunctional nuclease family protein [Myxococcota bacterium]|nr:bifunctional nuclease family protein [Myxococcota bacterium]
MKISLTALCLLLAAHDAAASPPKKRLEERMDVGEVFSAGDGQYVVILRTHAKPAKYLPIWIGETEAVTIRMRLDRQVPPRPLTLDLLETVLKAGSIKVTEVAIDDYKGGVFLGRVRLKQGARAWDVEARPSDAIGLAMGRHVPILVSRDILEGAGLDAKSLSELAPSDDDVPEKAKASHATSYDETL